MWDGRSIIVRFRRQRGNNCPQGEPKTSPKINNEAIKNSATNVNTEINEKDQSNLLEVDKLSVKPNIEGTKDNSDLINVTDSTTTVQNPVTLKENSPNQSCHKPEVKY